MPLTASINHARYCVAPLWACAKLGDWPSDLTESLLKRLAVNAGPALEALSRGAPVPVSRNRALLVWALPALHAQLWWALARLPAGPLRPLAELPLRLSEACLLDMAPAGSEAVPGAGVGIGAKAGLRGVWQRSGELQQESEGSRARLLDLQGQGGLEGIEEAQGADWGLNAHDCANVLAACARLGRGGDALVSHLVGCLSAALEAESAEGAAVRAGDEVDAAEAELQHTATAVWALGELARRRAALPQSSDFGGRLDSAGQREAQVRPLAERGLRLLEQRRHQQLSAERQNQGKGRRLASGAPARTERGELQGLDDVHDLETQAQLVQLFLGYARLRAAAGAAAGGHVVSASRGSYHETAHANSAASRATTWQARAPAAPDPDLLEPLAAAVAHAAPHLSPHELVACLDALADVPWVGDAGTALADASRQVRAGLDRCMERNPGSLPLRDLHRTITAVARLQWQPQIAASLQRSGPEAGPEAGAGTGQPARRSPWRAPAPAMRRLVEACLMELERRRGFWGMKVEELAAVANALAEMGWARQGVYSAAVAAASRTGAARGATARGWAELWQALAAAGHRPAPYQLQKLLARMVEPGAPWGGAAAGMAAGEEPSDGTDAEDGSGAVSLAGGFSWLRSGESPEDEPESGGAVVVREDRGPGSAVAKIRSGATASECAGLLWSLAYLQAGAGTGAGVEQQVVTDAALDRLTELIGVGATMQGQGQAALGAARGLQQPSPVRLVAGRDLAAVLWALAVGNGGAQTAAPRVGLAACLMEEVGRRWREATADGPAPFSSEDLSRLWQAQQEFAESDIPRIKAALGYMAQSENQVSAGAGSSHRSWTLGLEAEQAFAMQVHRQAAANPTGTISQPQPTLPPLRGGTARSAGWPSMAAPGREGPREEIARELEDLIHEIRQDLDSELRAQPGSKGHRIVSIVGSQGIWPPVPGSVGRERGRGSGAGASTLQRQRALTDLLPDGVRLQDRVEVVVELLKGHHRRVVAVVLDGPDSFLANPQPTRPLPPHWHGEAVMRGRRLERAFRATSVAYVPYWEWQALGRDEDRKKAHLVYCCRIKRPGLQDGDGADEPPQAAAATAAADHKREAIRRKAPRELREEERPRRR